MHLIKRILLTCTAAIAVAAPVCAQAASYAKLYDFTGSYGGTSPDGNSPIGNLAIYAGALYGVTQYGGTSAFGTVFKYDLSSKTASVIYNFTNIEDGGTPSTLINSAAKLYVATLSGGGGAGTISEIGAASHAETTRYTFGLEAEAPPALIDVGGTFYGVGGGGTSSAYGYNSGGTIFSVAPGAKLETLLYTLSESDGLEPNSLINANGLFYGTTVFGGANGGGSLFQFDPSTNKFKTLYSFNSQNGTDGYYPVGVTYANGKLYVVTNQGDANGAGAVYAFSTTGARTTLYSFTGKNDGSDPSTPLLYTNGVLVGAASGNGQYNHGTIYQLTLAGVETTIHAFGAKTGDGAYPSSFLVATGAGEIYGTTLQGGTAGSGTIFKFKP
jgi:uncharacterized repeat protein (TIGR03803 family)